jgi:nucleoid-associated protein YgaU
MANVHAAAARLHNRRGVPFLGIKRETKAGIVALLSFVILIGLLVSNKWKTGVLAQVPNREKSKADTRKGASSGKPAADSPVRDDPGDSRAKAQQAAGANPPLPDSQAQRVSQAVPERPAAPPPTPETAPKSNVTEPATNGALPSLADRPKTEPAPTPDELPPAPPQPVGAVVDNKTNPFPPLPAGDTKGLGGTPPAASTVADGPRAPGDAPGSDPALAGPPPQPAAHAAGEAPPTSLPAMAATEGPAGKPRSLMNDVGSTNSNASQPPTPAASNPLAGPLPAPEPAALPPSPAERPAPMPVVGEKGAVDALPVAAAGVAAAVVADTAGHRSAPSGESVNAGKMPEPISLPPGAGDGPGSLSRPAELPSAAPTGSNLGVENRNPNRLDSPRTAESAPLTYEQAMKQGSGWVALPVVTSQPEPTLDASPEPVRDGPPPTSVVSVAKTAESGLQPVVHTIGQNETFWTISRLFYATSRYYKALWAYNRDRVPDINQPLKVGTKIIVPPEEMLDRSYIDPPKASASRIESAQSPSSVRRASRPASDDGTTELFASSAAPARGRDASRKRGPRETVAASAKSTDPSKSSRPSGDPLTYKVKANETLRSIARDRLGNSRRADEIYQLNRDLIDDPQNLTPGQLIQLPDDARLPGR